MDSELRRRRSKKEVMGSRNRGGEKRNQEGRLWPPNREENESERRSERMWLHSLLESKKKFTPQEEEENQSHEEREGRFRWHRLWLGGHIPFLNWLSRLYVLYKMQFLHSLQLIYCEQILIFHLSFAKTRNQKTDKTQQKNAKKRKLSEFPFDRQNGIQTLLLARNWFLRETRVLNKGQTG